MFLLRNIQKLYIEGRFGQFTEQPRQNTKERYEFDIIWESLFRQFLEE